jgi:hypothetical protein
VTLFGRSVHGHLAGSGGRLRLYGRLSIGETLGAQTVRQPDARSARRGRDRAGRRSAGRLRQRADGALWRQGGLYAMPTSDLGWFWTWPRTSAQYSRIVPQSGLAGSVIVISAIHELFFWLDPVGQAAVYQGMPVRREGRFTVLDPNELSAWLGRESHMPGLAQVATDKTDLADALQGIDCCDAWGIQEALSGFCFDLRLPAGRYRHRNLPSPTNFEHSCADESRRRLCCASRRIIGYSGKCHRLCLETAASNMTVILRG